MTPSWPFPDPRETAVLSLQRIVKHGMPILYVLHDADGTWQFLDGADVSREDAMFVTLEQITQLDPTLLDLATLPLGAKAIRRTQCSPWQRVK